MAACLAGSLYGPAISMVSLVTPRKLRAREGEMKTKTMKYLSLAGVFLFFSSTGAAWASTTPPVPSDCELPNCCLAKIGFNDFSRVELIGGPTLVEGTCDLRSAYGEEVTVEPCYEYEYRITMSQSYRRYDPEDYIYFTFPYDPVNEILIGGEDLIKLYEPGEGVVLWAKDIYQIFVAKFLLPEANEFKIYSNVDQMSLATVGLQSGLKVGSCGIYGPAPPIYDPSEVFTLSSTEYINTSDGKLFKIIRDANTQCIIDAYECLDAPGCAEPRQLTSDPIGEVIKVKNGEFESDGEWAGSSNQKCNEALLKSLGEHTWVWISGRRVWR